jgi:hypothetical protein
MMWKFEKVNCEIMKNNENNPKKGTSQWADQVLDSLDGMERATANPFLYTRILALMEKKEGTWEKAANWISKPAFAFAMVLVFVAINATVLFRSKAGAEAAVAKKATQEQMLASEFTNTQTYTLVEVNEDK